MLGMYINKIYIGWFFIIVKQSLFQNALTFFKLCKKTLIDFEIRSEKKNNIYLYINISSIYILMYIEYILQYRIKNT